MTIAAMSSRRFCRNTDTNNRAYTHWKHVGEHSINKKQSDNSNNEQLTLLQEHGYQQVI
jgi:hypothetical protein